MKNRGMSFIFVSFIMFSILGLLLIILNMGVNDIILSKKSNDKSKSFFLAESGVYYGGSIIYEAVQSASSPVSSITVNQPFDGYIKEHGYNISITAEGSDYRVISVGNYNNTTQKIEVLVTITGNNISYTQMRKIN